MSIIDLMDKIVYDLRGPKNLARITTNNSRFVKMNSLGHIPRDEFANC